MASRRKNNHVQQFATDSSHVLERKLRPVYDCLDFGNYKKALQESEKVLKKHPTSATAKSLKALSLIRLNRHQEALPIAKLVHDTKPSDESTLQVLSICYKEANRLDLIAELYENAVDKCPDNEEYLSHLFMSHVRLGNYKRQQQIAVKLHKLKPDNNPYYYWSVMSLVLQASQKNANMPATLLAVAEKMAKVGRKNLAELELNAEVTLLCLILEKQEKFTETLDVMRGEKGSNLMTDEMFKQTTIAGLLLKVERVDEANALYKQLILDRPDNWEFYTSYISTSLQLIDSKYTPPSDSSTDCTYTEQSLVDFLSTNSDSNLSADKPQRAPLLALLELYQTLLKRSVDGSEQYRERLEEYLLQYCTRFGSKPCCYKDISKYFLLLLATSTAEELLRKVFMSLKLQPSADEKAFDLTDTKDIQKRILFHQLEKVSGALNDLSLEERVSRAQSHMSHFMHFATNVENEVLNTVVKTSDSYLLLAVHILVDVYAATSNDTHLLQALSWLEQGIKISPATHQISLLLVYIYSLIGAYGPVPQLVTQMEVKQILYDSVGYLYSGQAMAYGHFSVACLQSDEMLKYFNGSNREISDSLIQCYKFGTFSKVEEFCDYQCRAANSIQYALAVNEKHVLDLIFDCKKYDALVSTIKTMPPVQELDTIEWERLRDNRDIPVTDCWEQLQFTEQNRLDTFTEQKHWLRYRTLSIKLMVTSVHIASNGDLPTLSELMETSVKEFNEQLSAWRQFESADVPRFTTLSTRLVSEVKAGLADVFANLAALVLDIVNINTKSDHSPEKSPADRLTLITEGLEDCCKCLCWPATTGLPATYRQIAAYISGLCSLSEHLSFAVIYAGVLWKLYQPVRQAANPRKKKQGGQSKPTVSPLLMSSNTSLKSYLSKLKVLLSEVSTKTSCLSTDTLAEDLKQLTLEPSEKNEYDSLVRKNILISYDRTAKEVRELLAHKKLFVEELTAM